MAVVLSDRDARDLNRMLNEWRRNPLALVGGRTSQGRAIDHEEILPPESYVALSPSTGIPPLTTSRSSGGSSSGSGGTKYMPGFAVCRIYRILPDPDNAAVNILVDAGFDRTLCNLSPLHIAANTPISTDREKWGVWVIPWPGLSFKLCGSGGSSQVDDTGGGTGCCAGACGDEGVPSTVTATLTDKTGCLTTLPDSIELTCFDGDFNYHGWQLDSALSVCGGDNNFSPLIYCQGLTGRPYLTQVGLELATVIFCEDGWTCSPFSAVFFVDDTEGNTMTVTVVE